MSNNERQQAERIFEAYEVKEDSALDRLKKAHAKVQRPATVFAYVFGGIGSLCLGAGMSLIMTSFGAALGSAAMPVGIAIGAVGGLMAAITYPIYKKILAASKKKHAEEILALKNEVLGE
ncbi:MAG: dihydropteridine reductase [Clostridia bacterium]|nr:dihydropteridine reductase [Clostridia bacterium]